MGYSKKRRYRKKQRGGNETKTVFSYPESDMAYAQIYGLIQNVELRKSVIDEMTKGDVILFTSKDLAPKQSPGILDIELYKVVVQASEQEVYNVNPVLNQGVAATGSYTSETFIENILNTTYLGTTTSIKTLYENNKNHFLKDLINAFYHAAEKTLAPALQEKAFLKELFTNMTDQYTYIDGVFSSVGGTNDNIDIALQNGIVHSIIFKNGAAINGAKLAELDKLKGLKQITILEDITKYANIKSSTLEEVIIDTDTVTNSGQLTFLNTCPALKNITIKSKDLKGNISGVLNMLPSGKDKTMVDLKGSYALDFGDITSVVKVIKDKKITGIAFPNQMDKDINSNNARLSEALKPTFVPKWLGTSVSVSTEKINETLIEKYSELVQLFPSGFKIEEVKLGSDINYTISEGTVMVGQPLCTLTTTPGDETKNSRKLKTINFKKGMTRVVLNEFNELTLVSIDSDVELTEIKITDCKNADFDVEFSSPTATGTVKTKQSKLTSIVITGLTSVATTSVATTSTAATTSIDIENLDTLTEVDINWEKMKELRLGGCKVLKTVILPISLTRLRITEAPITNTDFLKPLVNLTNLDLTECSKFETLDVTSTQNILTELNLNGCASLTELKLDGYSALKTLSVTAPDPNVNAVASGTSSSSSGTSSSGTSSSNPVEMSLKTVEIIGCDVLDTLVVPSSVENLSINTASALPNTTFLSELVSLKTLTIQKCSIIETIDCKAFAQTIETLEIISCDTLTSISGLDDVPTLQTFTTTTVPMLKQLTLGNCAALNKVNITDVTRLVMKGCTVLESDKINLPTSLLSLEISGAGILNLDFLKNLNQKLEALKLDVNIADITIDGFTSLSTLEIRDSITTSVTIRNCTKLAYIERLPSSLIILSIDSSIIQSTRFLKDLNKLESLTIKQTQKYAVSDFLPATLKILELENSAIGSNSVLTIFENTSKLESVKISNDVILTNRGLSERTTLKTLELKQCPNVTITSITDFKGLTSIDIDDGDFTEFSIVRCDALISINLPKKVTALVIDSNIAGFDFTGLPTLTNFTIKNNIAVTEVEVVVPATTVPATTVPATTVPPAQNITKITTGKIIIPPVKNLKIESVEQMSTIKNMDNLKQTLEKLTIDNCQSLTTDLQFENFTELSILIIDKCPEVKTVSVQNCPNLTEMNGLKNMDALTELKITENGEKKDELIIPFIEPKSVYNKTGLKNITISGSKTNIPMRCNLMYYADSILENFIIDNVIFVSLFNEPCLEFGLRDKKQTTITNISIKNISVIKKYTNRNEYILFHSIMLMDCSILNKFVFDNVPVKILSIQNCDILSQIPKIVNIPTLTKLYLANLQITEMVVSNCDKLESINRLTGLDKLITLTISNNKVLNIIPPIKGMSTLTTLTMTNCESLTSLTVDENPVLTSLTVVDCASLTDLTVNTNLQLTTLAMTKLTALTTLTANNNGATFTSLDFVGVPNVETLTITHNPGLQTVQKLNFLSNCSLFKLNDNAINMSLDDFLSSLNETTDKTVILDNNADLTLVNASDVVETIKRKKVVGLYAAVNNGFGADQPEIYNYYRIAYPDPNPVPTNFINGVGGTVYSGAIMLDITLLQFILAIPDAERVTQITAINTLLNDKANTDKPYVYNNSSATFTQVGGDYRITKLVLDGDQISFTNVIHLDKLKSLTIDNNNTNPNNSRSFNPNSSKVLPGGLEEIIITKCPNFETVNLDNQTGTLKTFKHNNKNNTFRFENFQMLEIVELGELNTRSVSFKNCPNLLNAVLHESTKEVTINDSPDFPFNSLNNLSKIEMLTLVYQSNYDLSQIKEKIEGLTLENMPITTLKNEFAILKKLEIENCTQLTTMDIVAPQLESMKIDANNNLTKLNVQAVAQAVAPAGASSLIGLKSLKNLEIVGVKITELVIEGCDKLEFNNGNNNGNNINNVFLPPTISSLTINGGGEYHPTISNITNLKTLTITENNQTTQITLPALVESCNINNCSVNHIITENCKNTLLELIVDNCQLLNFVGEEQDRKITLQNYPNLKTLSVKDMANNNIISVELVNCQSLSDLTVPQQITSYTVIELPQLKDLPIPNTVTSVNVNNMNALESITYAGTAMTSFKVHNCSNLNTIPDFKTNNVKMTLLHFTGCTNIKPDLVAYLEGIGGAPGSGAPGSGVPGGSTKNKSRKVSGGTNNKSRRNKMVYRGGVVESIDEVGFFGTGATVSDINKLIAVIETKKIQKMFVPDQIKTQIEAAGSSNDFIGALKTQNAANPNIDITEITNVEVLPEESYKKKRYAIINGLKNVFTQIATQEEEERLEAERVAAKKAEADRAAKEEAERLAKEEAERKEADRKEADRKEVERLAKEEAERKEADRKEVERLAKEEAERKEAERLAKEEAERKEAERLAKEEAERKEAERLAKEEAERKEAERLAKEEAERKEADRKEVERLAKVEADRKEAERKKAELEHLAKVEADRLEAERVSEVERLAKIEADRVAEVDRLAKIEADRLEVERVAEVERLAKIEADRLEAERVADQERLAKVEADRIEAERVAGAERLAKVEADRLEVERVAGAERAEADRIEAKRVAEVERAEAGRLEAVRVAEVERAEADRAAAEPKEENIYTGKLWVCKIKTTVGVKGRDCGSMTNPNGFDSRIIKKGDTISLIIGTNLQIFNIIYVGNDVGANQNSEQHFFIQGDITSHVFLKTEQGKRNAWISNIKKAFNLRPLYHCIDSKNLSSKCEDTTLGRINNTTTKKSIQLYKYDINNQETQTHEYKNPVYVKISLDKGKNMNSGNTNPAIDLTYYKERTDGEDILTIQLLETNTKETRDWWIKEIQRSFQLVPLKTQTQTSVTHFYTGNIKNYVLYINTSNNSNTEFKEITKIESSSTNDNNFTITYDSNKTIELVSDNKDNRDWWVTQIQQMITKQINSKQSDSKRGGKKQSDGNQSNSNQSNSNQSNSNQSNSKQSAGKRGGKKQSNSKQSNSKQSVGKRGGKGFRATRKKIRKH